MLYNPAAIAAYFDALALGEWERFDRTPADEIKPALDRREAALRECVRVIVGGGVLLSSVMSLWGTVHAFLPACMKLDRELNEEIIRTGDLTATTNPGNTHHCHLYRGAELRALLEAHDLEVIALAASNTLATVWNEQLAEIRSNPEKWEELVAMEIAAGREPGCIDMGTHIIAVARRPE